MDFEIEKALPFSFEKQQAVLGHILFDEDFFNMTINVLERD